MARRSKFLWNALDQRSNLASRKSERSESLPLDRNDITANDGIDANSHFHLRTAVKFIAESAEERRGYVWSSSKVSYPKKKLAWTNLLKRASCHLTSLFPYMHAIPSSHLIMRRDSQSSIRHNFQTKEILIMQSFNNPPSYKIYIQNISANQAEIICWLFLIHT